MQTQDFLSKVLSDDGFYCVVGLKNGIPNQKFFGTLDSVIESASNLELDGQDVFFALGTFVEANNRSADNLKYLKAFFLDLDCGEGKPYPTKAEAIVALKAFRSHYKLPKWTCVVNSGTGMHVYWGLTAAIPASEWKPVANQLKQACAEFGFQVDAGVTADGSRILRVPGTHNHKTLPAKPTGFLGSLNSLVSFEEFKSCLPVSLIPVSTSSKHYSPEDRAAMDAALGNYTKRFSRLLDGTYEEGKGCNQLLRAATHPEDLTYHEWFNALSITKYCQEAPLLSQEISKGYPNYTAEETEKVVESIDSPHYCSTFEADNPTGCKGCVHKGNIKSPISLCMEVKEASEEDNIVDDQGNVPQVVDPNPNLLTPTPSIYKIPTYPLPFFRGVNGGVYHRTKDKKGNPDEVLIYPQDLYLITRLVDPLDGPCYVFRHHTQREGVQEFMGVGVKLSSPEEFRKTMGMNDVFLLRKDLDGLMNYTAAWITQLKNTKDPIQVRTQFGWTEGHQSFVVGNQEIFANHTLPNPPGARTAQYFPYFMSKGTLEGWKRVTAFYDRPQFEEHQYMFALSFGSPLMEFVPNIAGSIFHLTSAESGYGKTTGMLAGASVWGNHKRLVLKGKDTGNSVWNRAEVYKNIVLYVDELSNLTAKEASNFAYAVSDGEQRNRQSNAGQNLERMRGGEWSFLAGSTGNVSMLDKMSEYRALPKGEAQRVMEGTVTKKLNSDEQTLLARALNEDLDNNYGHAGKIYIQHVIQNKEQITKDVNKNIERIILDAGLDSQNRFWSAQTGATFTGALIAKHLGLLDWDMDAFYVWIIAKLKRMKHDMKDMEIDIGDLVGQFYQHHPRGFLRVKSTDDARMDGATEQMIIPDNNPLYQWVGRHEYDINKLYLLPKPFKEWVVKHGHHYHAIRKLIYKELSGRAVKIRLGRGTKIDLPPQHAIELSWNHDAYISNAQDLPPLFPVGDND